MREQQSGFTLIELIMVIAIMAALAIVVLPRYADLQGEAQEASVQGVAGSLTAASAINYAAWKANSSDAVDVDDCQDIGHLIEPALDAAEYAITAAAIDKDQSVTCVLTHHATGITATFVGYGVAIDR